MDQIVIIRLLWAGLGAAAGLVAGSFLSTIAIPWPRGETLAGRSRCDHCHHPLRTVELLPLLSWLWTRGRCRHCDAAIDPRHPLCELAAAATGLFAMLASPGLTGLVGALFSWWLLLLLLLDLERHWLPDRLTLPLLALGLLFGHGGWGNWPTRLAGAAMGGGALWLLAIAYRRLRRRHGLGLGDVKLVAALGAWLGPLMLGPLLGLAALLGLVLVGLQPASDTPLATRAIPFGACLAVVAFPLWLFLASTSMV